MCLKNVTGFLLLLCSKYTRGYKLTTLVGLSVGLVVGLDDVGAFEGFK